MDSPANQAKPLPFERYRTHVRSSIDRAVEFVARISFGDFDRLPHVSLDENDEFVDLLAGLAVLGADIKEAMREREEQYRSSMLRAELWQTSSASYEREVDFVQTLLDAVGPQLNVKRASYYAVDGPEADGVCLCQWCAEGVQGTPGLHIPFDMWKRLLSVGYSEVDRALLNMPECEPERVLMERTGIASVVGVLCGPASAPRGFVMFSDEHEHRVWSSHEQSLLAELANIVSSKLSQISAERALREANAQLESEVVRRTQQLSVANRDLQDDIDKRVKAEKALREREQLYRLLVETSPDAIIMCAPGGGIVMANGAAAELFGADRPDKLVGSSYGDLVAGDDRPAFIDRWNAVSPADSLFTVECRFVRLDGSSFLGEGRSVAVGEERAGRPVSILSIVRDITARRKQEEELFRAQKLESLGILAGGIAHDFNNVLTGIVSNLGLVRTRLEEQPELRQAIADAEEAALRATGLTKQLLTFARGGEPIRAPVSLRALLESAVRFCLSGSRITCCYDVQDDLLPVLVDRGQIDQVLSNLLINAVQAMTGEGSIVAEACNERVPSPSPIQYLAPGQYVKVTIRDTGPGIPAEHLVRVFDPYYTTKRDGIGLGLSTVYSVIRRHGGTVRCDSQPGKGTAFTFYLPVAHEAETPAAPPPNGTIKPGTRVLVMDDDPTVRMVMERLLGSAGCAVTITTGSAEAVRAFRTAIDSGEPFDAVLLDLTIPGDEGGKDTVRKLLAIDPDAAAAVVSGYSNDPVMADFRSYGFRAMLAKPFRMSELVHTVASLTSA